jgi:hypothetical protein
MIAPTTLNTDRRTGTLTMTVKPETLAALPMRRIDQPVFLSHRPAATMLCERSDTRSARQAALLPV